MPASPREIAIANRHPRLRFDRRALLRAIHRLDADFQKSKTQNRKSKILTCPPGELSLVFLTDAAQTQLHADFLADPTPTDVITFEGDPALGTAGEICVSADTAATYAKAHGRDFSTELLLYVVHGWLHLAGYDDLQPVKKRAMRRAESRAMKLLQAHSDCLPAFRLYQK
ncbi:MAG: rRNA maturation RNase YbeY [Verrucomicrobia bacterium]|nr:rRNA maturation RNase YbeY [Verrucomicrobiota bacterium]